MGLLGGLIDRFKVIKGSKIPMTPKMICFKEYCWKRANGSEDIIDAYEKPIVEISLSTGAPLDVAAMMSYLMLDALGEEVE